MTSAEADHVMPRDYYSTRRTKQCIVQASNTTKKSTQEKRTTQLSPIPIQLTKARPAPATRIPAQANAPIANFAPNPDPVPILAKVAKEAVTKDDIRHHKVRRLFLEIAEALDAQLANAQKSRCEEAQALAMDLKETLQCHLTRHTIGPRPPPRTTPNTYQPPPSQQHNTDTSQTEKIRVFICIEKQHTVRRLAPFTILQKLHAYLLQEAQISEVRDVPTGFALLSKNTTAAQKVIQSQNLIHKIIKESSVEIEEKWITAIIPELLTTTQNFKREELPITKEMALTELQLMSRT
ncbi:MAG: hypothetical protein M1839_006337 [Geoglossum umbratile]|nr:MAG: hypothetical protein M1839_006337 [Geoglossum umbratile]